MKKSTIIKIIAVLILLGAGAYFYFKKQDITPVFVEKTNAKKGNISTLVTATGTIQPITQVEVGTQVSGIVEKIYVDFNSKVKAGQLIAQIDKTNLRAALFQAQATYDNALNEQNYLQLIFDRQKALFDNKHISQADYDDANYRLINAKNIVKQRLSDLQRAQTNLKFCDIYSPIDGVVLSKAVDEGQTVAASLSTPTLFTIAQDLREMQVEAAVDEADIGQVIEGLRVTFTVDAFPKEEFNGKVTQVRLNPTTTSNVVTYTVVIKAENQELKLKPGLTATVSIFTQELHDILTLDNAALTFRPNQEIMEAYREQKKKNATDDKERNAKQEDRERNRHKKDSTDVKEENSEEKPHNFRNRPELKENEAMVWTINNDRIRPKKITTGLSDGLYTQIIDGISESDTLIIDMGFATEKSMQQRPQNEQNKSPFMPQMGRQRKR